MTNSLEIAAVEGDYDDNSNDSDSSSSGHNKNSDDFVVP